MVLVITKSAVHQAGTSGRSPFEGIDTFQKIVRYVRYVQTCRRDRARSSRPRALGRRPPWVEAEAIPWRKWHVAEPTHHACIAHSRGSHDCARLPSPSLSARCLTSRWTCASLSTEDHDVASRPRTCSASCDAVECCRQPNQCVGRAHGSASLQ